jgi:geranylgeranyl diphosphate synthase type 3/geranylgeranyl diphosphate synthase type I
MQLYTHWPVNLADDQPHFGTPMEWWFVQGFYDGECTGRREFMAALFRCNHKLPDAHAFSMLLSVLDPVSGRASSLSQVDPATCAMFVNAVRTSASNGFDPVLLRALADEVAECGPPHPLRNETTPVEIASAPFRVKWNGFELAHAANAFALNFTEPETGRRCRFHLTPAHSRIHLADIAVVGNEAMDYLSYPRLVLSGEVDGEAVRGQAWLDHQWGSHGWMMGEGVLGWDWLGIQLDDGHDLLVMSHREQRRQQCLCQYAVLLNATGPARLIRELDLTPTTWWTSPTTRTRYPLAWRLVIPDLELALDFTPSVNEQEIPMLSPIRAVWEGAGRVTGTWRNQAVAGRARLELHGYAYQTDLRQLLDGMAQRIRQHLEDYLPRRIDQPAMERYVGSDHGLRDAAVQTTMIATPLWDLLDRGGKRWRPIFGFLLLEALGIRREPYESLISCMAELAHGGSLVIDDIEDNATVRRGAEAIHLRYGLDVAINAGNTAYFLPMTLLRDYPHLSDAQRLELYRILSRVYVRAHLGQGQDIYWSKSLTPDQLRLWRNDSLLLRIIEMYEQKTAASIEGLAECSGVIANADATMRQACADFGRALGVAFQIVDDIVDFSAERIARGQGGRDLIEGKLTYVICRALQRLPECDYDRLATILCSKTLRQQTTIIAEGIELVRRSGALAASAQDARTMVHEEWSRLSTLLPSSEPKTTLRILWSHLLSLADDDRHNQPPSTH